MAREAQVGGTHYRDLGIEPFAVVDAWRLDYYLGCCIKYLARRGSKTGADELTDLRKARQYLDEAIERREKALGDARKP